MLVLDVLFECNESNIELLQWFKFQISNFSPQGLGYINCFSVPKTKQVTKEELIFIEISKSLNKIIVSSSYLKSTISCHFEESTGLYVCMHACIY